LGLRTSVSRRARYLAGQVAALVDLHVLPAVILQRLSQQRIQNIFREVFTRHFGKLDALVTRERRDPDYEAEDSRRSKR